MTHDPVLPQECQEPAPVVARNIRTGKTEQMLCRLPHGHDTAHHFDGDGFHLTWPNRDLLAGDPPTLEPSRLP